MSLTKTLNLVLAFCLVVALAIKTKSETMDVNDDTVSAKVEKTLFQETKLGNLTLKNRFIQASMGDHTPDGNVNSDLLVKYWKAAKGGVGTIITGFTLVDKSEQGMAIAGMYDDSFIPGNKSLVDTIHHAGANILMQLVYIGSNYHSPNRPQHILGASAVENPNTHIIPEEMTKSDIDRIVNEFAAAAVRAKKSGYDGVEIHACHGYLLHQFANPSLNIRTDEYGGSRENRYRLTVEVYDAIRKAVGNGFQVWIKVQSQDGYEGGVTNEDCLYLCQELAHRGIDAIEVSGNFWAYKEPNAYFKNIADRIAKETKVPVIVTGGNRDYNEMEHMIQETDIDYVGMARPLMANPNLINQMFEKFVKPTE